MFLLNHFHNINLCIVFQNYNIKIVLTIITLFRNYINSNKMEEIQNIANQQPNQIWNLHLEHPNRQNSLLEKRRIAKRMQVLRTTQDSQIYQNFIEISAIKTSNDKAVIIQSLKTHFALSQLISQKDILDILLEKFRGCKIMEGQYLMKQDNNASCFFILHYGKLALEINGVIKKNILPGQGFGQLALLYSAPRSASIKALKSSFLWFIDRQTFKTVIASLITKNSKQNYSFIHSNPFFNYLTQSQKNKLLSISIIQKFQKNSFICKEGELAASIYILKSGKLRKYRNQQLKGIIIQGQSFEDNICIKKDFLRTYTIKAIQDSVVMALGVQEIQKVLGKSLPLIILRNQAKNVLSNSNLFCNLSQQYIEKIIDCFKLKNVKRGEYLIRKEDSCSDIIFFVVLGQYYISKGNKKLSLYGEQSFFDSQRKYNYDIKMNQNGKIAWSTKDEILRSLGCPLKKALQKSKLIESMIVAHNNKFAAVKQLTKKLKLQDMLVIKRLGYGQFGAILLVSDKERSNLYALKCISKKQIITTVLQNHVINQKQARQVVLSPFVVQYIRSYKDDNFIYFLTEYINGIQLFDAIRIIGLMNNSQTLFYAMQILYMIQKMHQKLFIYRDLKPQNIMVCQDGYLKLISLGACKKIKVTQKTFTIIGTPNYMAPQILAGSGYSFPVDLWSLGIILYEFMTGFVPYGQNVEDPLQIYQQILKKQLLFPKNMIDPNLNYLIIQLLNKNPQSRLGGSFANLKKHCAFNHYSWPDLISKRIKPITRLPREKMFSLVNLKQTFPLLSEVLKCHKNSEILQNDMTFNWDFIF